MTYPLPTRAQRQRNEHSIEWSFRWQYAVTWRIIRDLDPATAPPDILPLLVPPDDRPGWEINVDYCDKGYRSRVPSWCKDGTTVMQSVHWRRPDPTIHWLSPDRRISINRTEP